MARRRPRDSDAPTGLRIIAGRFRGQHLETPPGRILRPMRDQVRLALFNILGPGALEGAAVLDLFAGSGSLGLEALSRGAARAVFVDVNEACLKVLRKNVSRLGVEDQATAVRHDLGRGLGPLRPHGPFQAVFAHPPFAILPEPQEPGQPDVLQLLLGLGRAGLLAPEAVVVWETPAEVWRDPAPFAAGGLPLRLRREYGSTALFVADLAPPAPQPDHEPEPPSAPETPTAGA